jgi:hypothetical protein
MLLKIPCFFNLCFRESIKDDNGIMYIVSGAGNTCCTSSKENINDVPQEFMQWYVSKENKIGLSADRLQGGFTSLKATAESLTFEFYDQDGNTLFSAPSVPPRE